MSDWYEIGKSADVTAGPRERTLLCKDTAVDDKIADSVPVFGAAINQTSILERVLGVWTRKKPTDPENLTVRFRLKYPSGVIHTVGEFTLEAAEDTDKAITFLDFDWPTFPDRAVLIPDVVASDGYKHKNGVATFTLIYVSRGAGLPTAEGLGKGGPFDDGTAYAAGDVVMFDGDAYVSRQNGNINHDPDVSPDWWRLIAEGGEDGAPGPGVAAGGTAGQILVKQSGSDYDTDWEDLALTVGVTLDGGGSAIPTGIAKRYTRVPNNCEIIGWTIIAHEASGSISIDVCAQANSAPPSTPVLPDTTTDKISASAPIALSAAQTGAGGSSAISTWSKTRAAWDVIGFNVTSVSGVTWAHVLLHLKRVG